MRIKNDKPQNGTASRLSSGERVGAVMAYVLAVTLSVMCVLVAFYAENGYNQIGNAKFSVYKVTMLAGFVPFLLLGAVYLVCFFRQEQYRELKLSVTDACVLVYLLFSTIAVFSGGFYEDALWGSFGWNMGWLSQLSFVLIYLGISRFGIHYRVILAVFCGSAFPVFLLAVLHRMLIDPIGFYEGLQGYQMAQFLSTMGQALSLIHI